jgi:uncharacterized protein YggT (Ycf19 family)
MWIENGNAHSKYNILHYKLFFILVSCWLVFSFLLVSITFFIPNTDSIKYVIISPYYPHLKVLRQSPMRFHDVVGKSAIYYPYDEGT